MVGNSEAESALFYRPTDWSWCCLEVAGGWLVGSELSPMRVVGRPSAPTLGGPRGSKQWFFLGEPHPENPSLFDSSCKLTCHIGFPCRTLGLCDLVFRVLRKTHRKKFECSAFPYNKNR